MPDGVALQDASIVACAVGTILNAMREVGKLAAGESALVTGAGGGLGMHAVQLARLAGAFVIAQTTSPEKAEQIRALGAHEVIVHARGEDFSGAVRKADRRRRASMSRSTTSAASCSIRSAAAWASAGAGS